MSSSLTEAVVLSPRNTYLHLSSEYAINNGSTSNVSFPVADAVTANTDNYAMLIGIHNFTLPHSWYNLNGYNFSVTVLPNVLGIATNTYNVTITTQNYTAALLATTLTNALNTAYGSVFWTMVYDAASNYFSLSATSAIPFQINYVTSSCYYELGAKALYFQKSPLIGLGGSLRFPQMCDLTGPNGVYVNLLNHNTYQRPSYQGLSQSNILCRIPVDTSFGAVQVYMPDNIQYSALPNAALSSLNFTLTDDSGTLLNLNGCDWTMTVHIKFAEIQQPILDSSNSRVATYSMKQPYGR